MLTICPRSPASTHSLTLVRSKGRTDRSRPAPHGNACADAAIRLGAGPAIGAGIAYVHSALQTDNRSHTAVLLLSSRLGIKEIAEETGFCDCYHFSRVFARRHNMGPARFRVLHGGNLSTMPTTSDAGENP